MKKKHENYTLKIKDKQSQTDAALSIDGLRRRQVKTFISLQVLNLKKDRHKFEIVETSQSFTFNFKRI